MTTTRRFRLWVLGGLLLPPFGALACAALASGPECLTGALTWIGTGCEIAGLTFAAVQLDSLAKAWRLDGFWQRLAGPKPIKGELHATLGELTASATGTLSGHLDRTHLPLSDRIDLLEKDVVAIRDAAGRVSQEWHRKVEALEKKLGELRNSSLDATRALEEQVKRTSAVADFGAGFFAIFVTAWGMVIANFAGPLSGWFR